jgi:hypothetical protein
MDKREAKRTALFRAGLAIEGNLAAGWPEDIEPEADRDRVIDALNELAAELSRRSGRIPANAARTPGDAGTEDRP